MSSTGPTVPSPAVPLSGTSAAPPSLSPSAPAPPPPAALKPTFDKHLDAVKWVIALPVAVLFGTTQFVEKVDFVKHPSARSLFFWIIVVNAAAAVLSVVYYFRAIKRADDKLSGKTAARTFSDNLFYYSGLSLFPAGFILAVIGLIKYPSVLVEKTPPPPPGGNFVISVSGPVRDRAGSHVHTFLTNQATGEVWEMECRSGSSVRFVRVPVEDMPAPGSKNVTK